jgi:hypothetical protein
MDNNFLQTSKNKKMNPAQNIFENAISIKSFMEKIKEAKGGVITFMTTGSCLDTGPTMFVSNQNSPFTHAATNK